jgi:hypothetical protein
MTAWSIAWSRGPDPDREPPPGRRALPEDVLPRRAFVLLALAGCLPHPRRGDEDAPPREPDGEVPEAGAPKAGAPAAEAGGTPGDAEVPGAPAEGDPPPHPTHEATPPTDENLQARAAALRKRYGAHGLSVRVERPFVLVGNEGPRALREHAEGTVRWAVERLERAYFDAPPLDIVEVWLLGDDESYRAYAWSVFADRPDTPYGYFTPEHQALVMNIATGGGTLVHELVHPFIESDFPACPAWLNEGLASLYEQCSDRDGQIWGLTNWRLPALQEAIEAGRLPSFTALLSTTRDEFYEADPGSNYGQARYLCYHLQEEGRLRAFYRDFRCDAARDPTGVATLRAHVGKDLEAFQQRWEAWVLGLRYG